MPSCRDIVPFPKASCWFWCLCVPQETLSEARWTHTQPLGRQMLLQGNSLGTSRPPCPAMKTSGLEELTELFRSLRMLNLKSSKWPPNLLATLCLQLQMHVGSLSTSHCWQLLHTAQVEPKIVSLVEAEGILKQNFDEQLAHAPVWFILVTLSWRTRGVQGIFSLHRLEQVYPTRSMSLLNPWQTRWDLHGSMPSKDKSEPGECLWNPNGVAAGNTAGYYWWSFWEKGSAWGS